MGRVPVLSGARSPIGGFASCPEFIFQNGGSNNRPTLANHIRRREGDIEGMAGTEITGSAAPLRPRNAFRPTFSEMGTDRLNHMRRTLRMIMVLPGQANGWPAGFGKSVLPSEDRMRSRFVVRRHQTLSRLGRQDALADG